MRTACPVSAPTRRRPAGQVAARNQVQVGRAAFRHHSKKFVDFGHAVAHLYSGLGSYLVLAYTCLCVGYKKNRRTIHAHRRWAMRGGVCVLTWHARTAYADCPEAIHDVLDTHTPRPHMMA